MVTILIYASLVLCLIYYLLKKNNSYWEIRKIPQDKPFLFFGNLYDVVVGKQGILERITQIYLHYRNLPYVGFYTFTKPVLMVNNPDLIKRILVKDFDKFINRDVTANEYSDPIGYHSLFSTRDKTWRSLRTKISPVFSSGKMKMMLPLMMECAQNLYEALKNSPNGIVDVKDTTKRYSVDVISSCAFGINANCLKHKHTEILNAAEKIIDQSSFIRSFSLFCFFFIPKFARLLRLKIFDMDAANLLLNIFTTAVEDREKLQIERHDLIDLLNQMKKTETQSDEYQFDDVKMAAQAMTFFSAGNETTATTIAFTLHELALNKPVQERLRREIRESYEENNGFTYDTINQMKYLNMVFNETLRKYPVTTFLSREALEDYPIEDGFKIEKGTSIMIAVCGLHYDPEYFPNPHKFDPERYNDDNKNNIKPYTLMPFGEGPRNCIGQRFGLLSAKVALVHLLKDFEYERTANTPVPLKLKPKAIFLQHDGAIPLRIKSMDCNADKIY